VVFDADMQAKNNFLCKVGLGLGGGVWGGAVGLRGGALGGGFEALGWGCRVWCHPLILKPSYS